jgi:hypothetical protein
LLWVRQYFSFQHPGIQPLPDEAHYPSIIDPSPEELHQPTMVYRIEESTDICVHYPPDIHRQALFTQCM